MEMSAYPINEEKYPNLYPCPKCGRIIKNVEKYSVPDMCDECSEKEDM